MSTDKKYYLAGPMSGIRQFNFPAFLSAADHLRELGYEVISPAEIDTPADTETAMSSIDGDPGKHPTKTWGDFLSRDVKIVADQVQGIIFLPGWEQSKGARLEAFVGLLCSHEFFLYSPWVGVLPISREEIWEMVDV